MKITNNKRLLFSFIIISASVLSGCGGDSKDSKTEIPPVIAPPVVVPDEVPDTTPEPIINGFDLANVEYKAATEKFTLHSMISNNVVFQQNKAIRLFGQAEAGTLILAKFTHDTDSSKFSQQYTVVPESGEWEVELAEMSASYDTYTLTISDGTNESNIENCQVGEVWIMSGQSNMELKVNQMEGGPDVMASIAEDNIRIFYQDVSNGNAAFPFEPEYDVQNGHWEVANSGDNVADSSAIGLAFATNALALLKAEGQNVPVAIINAHRGGSKIQSWLPRAVVEASPEITKFVTDKPDVNGKGFAIDNTGWNTHDWDNYIQVSALFNRKIHPISRFNIKGVTWYQGESDPEYMPNTYTITALIESWSELFNRNDELLEFALIQLHPYNGQDPMSADVTNYGSYKGFADHRRAQLDIATDPKYADYVRLVPIYDVGLAWETSVDIFQWKDPIHPLDKAPVGERLADIVVNSVYLDDDTYLAPLFESMDVTDELITVTFKHVGEGLQLFKDADKNITTVQVSNRAGQTVTVTATISATNQIQIATDQLVSMSVGEIKFVTYSNLSRNEQSNLADSFGTPAIPFVADTGIEGSVQVNTLTIFDDEITEWQLAASSTANITEMVVDDDVEHGKVIEHTYAGNQIVSDFVANYVMDLSDYKGGTLEFDFKLVKQPDNDAAAQWFIKIDCGWPCGTGDVPVNESLEGENPVVGEWQHYSFDLDYLESLGGGVESDATPLNISSVVAPLVIFPAWGANQEGAVFRIDNIKYHPADLVIFDESITDWALPSTSASTITEEVVDAVEVSHGKVIQHTYIGNQTVSEFRSAQPKDLSGYKSGKVEFDLLVVEQGVGSNGNWYIKVDCGWPCGTGDVALTSSTEGIMPTKGVWQHYTFDLDYLRGLPGGNDTGSTPLNISAVNSPLVVFPSWGSNQAGTVFQIDNIVYTNK